LATAFHNRIGGLLDDYGSGTLALGIFDKTVKELNRKLYNVGLSGFIVGDVDGGFRPKNIKVDFFGGVATTGTSDFLEQANDDYFLQENGFKLALEQDL
jgi:hypothetical protein